MSRETHIVIEYILLHTSLAPLYGLAQQMIWSAGHLFMFVFVLAGLRDKIICKACWGL